MTKKEKLIDLLQETNYPELVLLHNDYCYAIDDVDNVIYSVDVFEEVFQGSTPWEIANRVHFGDFNPFYEYFKFDGYGNIKSIPEHGLDSTIEIVEIVDYILSKDFDFDSNDIRYILDDIEEDSDND
jgi:hypothetical protein